MAATDKGVWDLQEVRDKQLLGEWEYETQAYGGMYAVGQGYWGKLGQNAGGPGVDRSSPIQITAAPSPWKEVGGLGPAASLSIRLDGTLWAWGYNNQGGLGLNQGGGAPIYGGMRSSPTQVGTGSDWATINTGESTAMAVKTDGSLWMWGNNGGKVTSSNLVQRSSPTQVPGTWSAEERKNFTQDFAAAIKPDGTLWMWGSNTTGVLGLNAPTPQKKSSPTQVGSETTWKYVAGNTGGTSQCFGIKTDGTAWAWGENGSGELGQNNTTPYSSPIQIAGSWTYIQSGDDNVKGIKGDGTLWSWGSNTSGVGGWNGTSGGPSSNASSPIQIGTGTWVDISSDRAAAMVKGDGTIWGVGSNGNGELGCGDDASRSSPIQMLYGGGDAWRVSSTEYSLLFSTRT